MFGSEILQHQTDDSVCTWRENEAELLAMKLIRHMYACLAVMFSLCQLRLLNMYLVSRRKERVIITEARRRT